MAIFPPDSLLRLLEALDLRGLTAEQAVAEYSLKGASPGYYTDRLEAIIELADVAGRRLEGLQIK